MMCTPRGNITDAPVDSAASLECMALYAQISVKQVHTVSTLTLLSVCASLLFAVAVSMLVTASNVFVCLFDLSLIFSLYSKKVNIFKNLQQTWKLSWKHYQRS